MRFSVSAAVTTSLIGVGSKFWVLKTRNCDVGPDYEQDRARGGPDCRDGSAPCFLKRQSVTRRATDQLDIIQRPMQRRSQRLFGIR